MDSRLTDGIGLDSRLLARMTAGRATSIQSDLLSPTFFFRHSRAMPGNPVLSCVSSFRRHDGDKAAKNPTATPEPVRRETRPT